MSLSTYNIFIQLIETKNSKVLFHLIFLQSKGDKSEKFNVKQCKTSSLNHKA